MKITLGPRNRGLTSLLAVVIICLLVVFVAGMAVVLIRAMHKIDGHNIGGGGETNDLAYSMVWSTTNQFQVPIQFYLAESVEEATNVMGPWLPVANFILYDDQPMDFNPPVDKTKPMEFFRITIYGTNQ